MGRKLRDVVSDLCEDDGKIFWLVLFSIIAYSFFVRIFYAKSGLPYVHNWDEPQTASAALQMLKTGDFNPHFFNYGTLLIYVNFFADIFGYLYLMGVPEGSEEYLTKIDDIRINADTGWHWTISHPSFYYMNRVVTVLFGTGTVIFTYLVTKNALGDKWLGVLSAAFLGVLGYHIVHSAYITTDVPVAFFVVGSVYFSIRFFDCGKTKHLVASLIFCGFAAATKYNSALTVLLPAIVIAFRFIRHREGFNNYWIILLPLVPMAVFLLVMPYALLDLVVFLKGIGYEVRHYKVLGHRNATSQAGLNHIAFQLNQFHRQLGVWGSGLAIVGLLGVFFRPKLVLVLLLPIVYFLYMTQMKVNFHRNFVQVYPFIAIMFAASLVVIYEAAVKIPPLATGRMKKVVKRLLIAFFSIYLSQSAVQSWGSAIEAKDSLETRSRAIMAAKAIKDAKYFFIAKELRVHDLDLKKLGRPYKVKLIKEMSDCFPDGSVLVVPRNVDLFYKNSATDITRKTMRFSHDILSNVEAYENVSRIGGERPLWLDVRSVNPGVVVAQISRVQGCSLPNGLVSRDSMLFSKPFPVSSDGTIALIWNGEIALPGYRLEPGTYLLRIEYRGDAAESQNAEIEVAISNMSDQSVITRRFYAESEFRFKNILLDIGEVGEYEIKIAFINDAQNKERGEDRNAYVRGIYLYSLDVKPDFTPWDYGGNLLINGAIEFSIANNNPVKELDFSLDNNDKYELCINWTDKEAPYCKVFGPTLGGAGLKNYRWNLEGDRSMKLLTVRPVRGDGKYSIGHINLHAGKEG